MLAANIVSPEGGHWPPKSSGRLSRDETNEAISVYIYQKRGSILYFFMKKGSILYFFKQRKGVYVVLLWWILARSAENFHFLCYGGAFPILFRQKGGLSYIFLLSLKRGGLSYISSENGGIFSIFANLKKGSLPVHLFNGSAPPGIV